MTSQLELKTTCRHKFELELELTGQILTRVCSRPTVIFLDRIVCTQCVDVVHVAFSAKWLE